jgi:Tfp pilus assembly protein PilO
MSRNVHTSDAGDARSAQREHVAGRLAMLRGARRTGFLGVPEIVALAFAAALLALAFAAYFLLLVPERSNLASLERERQQLQTQIRSAGESREQKLGVDQTVERIKQSLAHFETESLVPRETSERALYEELNDKIRRSGLQRAQFSFAYQDDAQAGAQQSGQQRAAGNLAGSARRRQTVFPATDISLTVEGNYANLRRFIREVESSPRFVVINGVQLEGLNDTSGGVRGGGVTSESATAAGPAGRGGATGAGAAGRAAGAAPRGALVSLRLDMSAYFRRGAAAPADQSGATAARQGTSQ